MLMNTSIKSLLILSTFHPQPFKWKHSKFSFLLSLLLFPPSIAFTQKQNQKARHSCRAQNSQKQTRAQLSCLLLSQLSFPFQPSAKPFGNFPLYFHCFAEYWEIQKSPKYFHLSSQWSISQWAHRALREVSLAMRRGLLHYFVLGLMVDQHPGPPLAHARCGWIIEHS